MVVMVINGAYGIYWEFIIIPTDEFHHFSEGYTTNQLLYKSSSIPCKALSEPNNFHHLADLSTCDGVSA